jgi:hypothetical protein
MRTKLGLGAALVATVAFFSPASGPLAGVGGASAAPLKPLAGMAADGSMVEHAQFRPRPGGPGGGGEVEDNPIIRPPGGRPRPGGPGGGDNDLVPDQPPGGSSGGGKPGKRAGQWQGGKHGKRAGQWQGGPTHHGGGKLGGGGGFGSGFASGVASSVGSSVGSGALRCRDERQRVRGAYGYEWRTVRVCD